MARSNIMYVVATIKEVEEVLRQAAIYRGKGLNCWEMRNCGRRFDCPVGNDGAHCAVPVTEHIPSLLPHHGKHCWHLRGTPCTHEKLLAGGNKPDCESCVVFLSHAEI